MRKFSIKTIASQSVIKQVLQQIFEEHNTATNGTDNSNNNIDDDNISYMNNESATLEKHPLLVISYQGKTGYHILKSLKIGVRKMLPNNVKPRIAFTGWKVGISFQIKDKTEMKHNHDIVYYNECLPKGTMQLKLHWWNRKKNQWKDYRPGWERLKILCL